MSPNTMLLIALGVIVLAGFVYSVISISNSP